MRLPAWSEWGWPREHWFSAFGPKFKGGVSCNIGKWTAPACGLSLEAGEFSLIYSEYARVGKLYSPDTLQSGYS